MSLDLSWATSNPQLLYQSKKTSLNGIRKCVFALSDLPLLYFSLHISYESKHFLFGKICDVDVFVSQFKDLFAYRSPLLNNILFKYPCLDLHDLLNDPHWYISHLIFHSVYLDLVDLLICIKVVCCHILLLINKKTIPWEYRFSCFIQCLLLTHFAHRIFWTCFEIQQLDMPLFPLGYLAHHLSCCLVRKLHRYLPCCNPHKTRYRI